MDVATRDRKQHNEVQETSGIMKSIQKNFSRVHAMAIHLNAIAIIMTVWYGLVFASRINIA